MQNTESKRLFFGFSVQAPWPSFLPKGRIIAEETRHITFAFLGNHPYEALEKALPHLPQTSFLLGPVGLCDRVVFLPIKTPRVVAYHVDWLTDGKKIIEFQSKVLDWLESLHYPTDKRPLLPHVTVARAPFDPKEWEEAFYPLPCILTGVHLYESLGNLTYNTLWHRDFSPVFEEFEHTADIAYRIRGHTPQELYLHAAVAMSFRFPHFLHFLGTGQVTTLDQAVQALNTMISRCDAEIGCPFKAVSYHGNLTEENTLLHWEMIVDV